MNKLAIVATLAVSTVLASASAAHAVAGAATVQIVNAIAITTDRALSFGQIIAGVAASTVSVTPQGARAVDSGNAVLAGGTVSGARFAVTGGIDSAYTVTIPATATLTGPAAATLTVSSLTSSPTGAGLVLDSAGTQTLLVGGVLAVPVVATTAPGIYSGTFDVTVAYN